MSLKRLIRLRSWLRFGYVDVLHVYTYRLSQSTPPPISSNPVLPIIPKFNPNTNYSFNPIPNLNRIAVGEI